jgi:hypothetical protein
LLKFGEDATPDWFGDTVAFAPGSLFTDDHQAVALLVQHDERRDAAGYATAIWTEGDYLLGEFETLDTPAGRAAALELGAPEKPVRADVSVGVYVEEATFEELDPPEDHPWPWPPLRQTITSADLAEVSLCFRGRMPSARVDEIADDTDQGVPTP